MLFRRLESWTQWRFGEGLGRAFVATTGPTALPAAVQAWASQHRDAVWQLVWLKGPAVLCGLALVGPSSSQSFSTRTKAQRQRTSSPTPLTARGE